MSSIGIPRQIKKILTCQCEKQYTKALKARKKTYREWLTEVEESHSDYVSSEKSSGEQVICLPLKEGCMTLAAVPICSAYMEAHPQALILYGDEDIMENGIRHTPRFLPDWSPDTFLGQTDIYGMIVVRRKWLQSLPAFWDLSEQTWISFGEEKRKNIVKQLITLAGGFAPNCHTIGHVPRVLFHKTDSGNRKEKVADKDMPDCKHPDGESTECMVSVIIPSKDHPGILEQNLKALVRTVKGTPYEVLVVDNGSGEENRKKIGQLLQQIPVKTTYLYEPMEFHFSRMCNLGARNAAGRYLLFLNDDVEMCVNGWMQHMVKKAAQSHAGAVGIKLYYPDSVRIQHAGIVNLPMGPVHKLQFLNDDMEYEDGFNRTDRNVIAVTGACLMIEREKFVQAGGMSSELPVAFNDVDLCFRLWEMGYHNIVCNSIYGYHHESLSRGDDESFEKLQRLLSEKAKLYARHPLLQGGVDPYYSVYLNRDGLDTRIRPAYENGGNEIQIAKPVLTGFSQEQYRLDDCLLFRVERCEETCVQGYGVVLGDNNACYEKTLILQNTKDQADCYQVRLTGQYRPELVENMEDQIHVGLCGFWWKPWPGSLPKGSYRVGMTAKSKVGRLLLLNWSNHILTIEGKVGKENE